MCGRYTESKKTTDVKQRIAFDRARLELIPRFNIAPTQDAPVVVVQDGEVLLKPMRWGLIPFWAKDESIGDRMIKCPGGVGEGKAVVSDKLSAKAVPGGRGQLLRMAAVAQLETQTADADSAPGRGCVCVCRPVGQLAAVGWPVAESRM
jgi:hypothetical protein